MVNVRHIRDEDSLMNEVKHIKSYLKDEGGIVEIRWGTPEAFKEFNSFKDTDSIIKEIASLARDGFYGPFDIKFNNNFLDEHHSIWQIIQELTASHNLRTIELHKTKNGASITVERYYEI